MSSLTDVVTSNLILFSTNSAFEANSVAFVTVGQQPLFADMAKYALDIGRIAHCSFLSVRCRRL